MNGTAELEFIVKINDFALENRSTSIDDLNIAAYTRKRPLQARAHVTRSAGCASEIVNRQGSGMAAFIVEVKFRVLKSLDKISRFRRRPTHWSL